MNDKDKIVLVYTGSEVIIERIRVNLEMEGINSIKKDGFRQGINAGFVVGTPSTIDLFVLETDFKKATEIINDVLKNQQKDLKLLTQYQKKIAKILGPKKAFRFIQIEEQINAIRRVQVLEIPLVD